MESISDTARQILNDPARIAKRDDWFAVMGDLFAGRRNEYLDRRVLTVMGTVAQAKDPQLAYANPEAWVVECLEEMAARLDGASDVDRFAPACVEYGIYGVHFIDKMFGADVFFQDGQWNARYLTTEIGTLKQPNLATDETWALARRAAEAFLAQDVALPLFGLPTLSSALNIIVNLYGGEALAMMIEEPEAAAHDLKIINETIMATHRWYLDHMPLRQMQPVISWCRTQPPGYGQLCGCTMQLVSGPMYQELIAPLDDALLGLWPHGGMIHLCGSHTQHIETLRGMKNLKAVQLNDRAAHDLKAYYEGLRDDQIIYLNPCEGMTIQQSLQITGGDRLVICEAVDAPKRPCSMKR